MNLNNKKKIINLDVAVHWIQADLLVKIRNKTIDFNYDSLRGMAIKIGSDVSAQQIKHHLDQLVKLGAIDYVKGGYKYNKTNTGTGSTEHK